MNFNFDTFNVRCSAIAKVLSTSRDNPCLTEKQAIRLTELENKESLTDKMKLELADLLVKKENSTKVVLSDTCIEYLMEEYAWRTARKQSVTKEMDMEYTQKGKEVEEESITLLSRVDFDIYHKNTERVNNDFLSGEPDIFLGEAIMRARKITDIKSCWDYPTFLKKIHKKADNGYDWQVKGYMDITGADEGDIAYCLVCMPESIQNDYRRRLLYKMNVATEENPEYLAALAELENSMTFTDIPIHKRVFKVKIDPMGSFQRQQVYDRVKVCREWLFNFDAMYQQINLPVEEIEFQNT
jgi:hypothetical protein